MNGTRVGRHIEVRARPLGIGVPTVRRFADAGELPADRIGRVIRVPVVDLEAFIEVCPIELRWAQSPNMTHSAQRWTWEASGFRPASTTFVTTEPSISGS